MVNYIEHRAPNRLLGYTKYNIPTNNAPQTDCPRFTERRDPAALERALETVTAALAQWDGKDAPMSAHVVTASP